MWERFSRTDPRPKWADWVQNSPAVGPRRWVWFREVDRDAIDINLPPGRYTLGAHAKSPCGHYGGDIFKTFDVEEGERVVVIIPH